MSYDEQVLMSMYQDLRGTMSHICPKHMHSYVRPAGEAVHDTASLPSKAAIPPRPRVPAAQQPLINLTVAFEM